jgi:hypothetical protein
MSELITQKQPYMVSVYEPEDNSGTLIFTFVPKGLQAERGLGGQAKRVPQFIVAARQEADGLNLDWSRTPDDPRSDRDQIEAEIAARMKDRAIWIDRVTSLAGQVQQWAKEMGWSTRRVEKRLDDPRIGKHHVPALLMQEDTCRVLLEPVGRSAPGAEGVVDLYPGTKPAATVREAEALPLSKEALEKVLAEMRRNAA